MKIKSIIVATFLLTLFAVGLVQAAKGGPRLKITLGEVTSRIPLIPNAEVVPLDIVVTETGYIYVDAQFTRPKALRVDIQKPDIPAFKQALQKSAEWCDVAKQNNVKDVSKSLGKVGNLDALFYINQKTKSCEISFGAGLMEVMFVFTGKHEMLKALDAISTAEKHATNNDLKWQKERKKEKDTEALFQ